MSLLVTAKELDARRAIASASLAALADSLAADLEPLLNDPPAIPRDKARLSRAGGRCPRDGANLEYDPWSPGAHRCPRCGAAYDDDAHYRYWLMWHHLWLAERAVHGALLFALRGHERHAALARHIIDGYTHLYLDFPNRDNVLGPSRVFFSTYLESIWLLQLCVAIDLLEMAGTGDDVTARARDRIVQPAAAIIAEYDEGTSNRQAWNVAARFAAARLLGRERDAASARSSLDFLLRNALLDDGSWYEGENYHVFAHRGLWYGVTMAERAGMPLEAALAARFDRGFAIPFRTALPDFTMLARRDSQYAISLRQWRFAELCELGLARSDDPELRAALARLYEPGVARGDTGRARSSAEAERHSPASTLDRSDLGWRSLLHARASLPPLAGATPRSVLLPTQGLAVFRRDGGRLFVAVDYGESGGGHGHPDRLNLVLCDGETRWLDDPGTGSYVDRSLHWYRSTLAHCAPLADRASQLRRSGELLAHDERGGAGWIAARAAIADGVVAERRVVTMADYVVDELSWSATGAHRVALPIHLDPESAGVAWTPAPLGGSGGLEDGFDFVERTEVATPAWPLRLAARQNGREADLWIDAPEGTSLWRCVAPGPPGTGPRPFLLLESAASRGSFVCVLAPRRTVVDVALRDATISVAHADGTVHEHAGRGATWRIDLRAGAATSSIELGGAVEKRVRPASRPSGADAPPPPAVRLANGAAPVVFELGEREYRRSEQSWRDVGAPTAAVSLRSEDGLLHVEVHSRTGAPVLVADEAVNEMDNESPDVNGSGVEIFAVTRAQYAGWLVRPGADGTARVRPLAPDSPPIDARVELTTEGWRARVTLDPRGLRDATRGFHLAVVVNEIPPGRERRRGQLVLAGRPGGWVYLRGDRHQDLAESIRVELA